MIWPFSNKKRNAEMPHKLPFKSGQDFLEYQCKYGHTEIKPQQGIVALVLDSSKEFGTEKPVKIEDDGRQMVALKVASEDGGFVVLSQTPTGKGDRLNPDDIVIWVPVEYKDVGSSNIDMAELDPRFGWVGFIVAKVKPEIDTRNSNFEIVSDYT